MLLPLLFATVVDVLQKMQEGVWLVDCCMWMTLFSWMEEEF